MKILAQDATLQASDVTDEGDSSETSTLTMLPHLETDRLWISGQANFISQWHPTFHSPYQGPNSLSPQAQDATSRVLTLFTGVRINGSTELLCDVQETGGHGIGEALGLAGFTNLDVVRNPTLSKAPYIARLMWHEVIPLGPQEIAGANAILALQHSSRTPHGNSLRQIQPRGFFRPEHLRHRQQFPVHELDRGQQRRL